MTQIKLPPIKPGRFKSTWPGLWFMILVRSLDGA